MSKGNAERIKLLQKWEAKLTLPQKAVWDAVMALLPKDSPLVGDAGSWGLECALMAHVHRGATVEQIVKMRLIPQRPRYDHRAASSGDRDAA